MSKVDVAEPARDRGASEASPARSGGRPGPGSQHAATALGTVPPIPTAQVGHRERNFIREHLRQAQQIIPNDAAQLVGYDRFSNKHVELASDGYSATSAYALCVDFPRNWPKKVWKSIEDNDPLPPTISSERSVPGSFRRSALFTEVLQRDGFQDGISVELVVDRQRVGLLHMSSRQGDFYGTDLRHRAHALGVLLSHIVSNIMIGAREIPVNSAVGTLRRDGLWTAMPTDTANPLGDPTLASIIAPLFVLDFPEASFLWQHDKRWFRIHCEVLPDDSGAPAGGRSATLPSASRRRDPRGILVIASPTQRPAELTAAEIRVLTLMIVCPSNDAIARILGVSDRTIHTHVGRVLEKLGCEKRTQAVVRAVRASVFSPFEHPAASLAALLG